MSAIFRDTIAVNSLEFCHVDGMGFPRPPVVLMKNSVVPWIAIIVLGVITFIGKNACVRAAYAALALVTPRPAQATTAPAGSDASRTPAALGEPAPSASATTGEKEPPVEPGVFYLRSAMDVRSAIGTRHLPPGTRVTQVSEDHSGTCTVDDGTTRFSINFAQLTENKAVAKILSAQDSAKK